ncbi:MAG: hypothetical protein JWP47_1594 [Polaromonas sp.]|nr:hypothetical protein [Polaromonas sp.]
MNASTRTGIECAKVDTLTNHLSRKRASAMKHMTVDIDLEKNVFQVHGIDDAWQGAGKTATSPRSDGHVLRQHPSVSDQHGSLQQRPLLGA